ncbi:hypothetical protein Ancab_021076 [Ancistrocladus abbreviatus]
MESSILYGPLSGRDLCVWHSALGISSPNKKRKMTETNISVCHQDRNLGGSLPVLQSSDYYTEPSLKELSIQELLDPGYCSRVPDFTVGRLGHGYVKFLGETDVRWLDLEQIVKFRRHEVVVYEDESAKPAVGHGLNKAAEVTLVLQLQSSDFEGKGQCKIVDRLRLITNRQGANFNSFDPSNGEWKFSVHHFSRFGLSEDEEEDIVMDDATAIQYHGLNTDNNDDFNGDMYADPSGPELSHSLPAHLGLDPVRMKEMRMLMFPLDDEGGDSDQVILSHEKQSFHEEPMKSLFHRSKLRMSDRPSPPVVRKTPVALIEYNGSNFERRAPSTVLLAQKNKGLLLRMANEEGFRLDSQHKTPLTGTHSCNIVDAALFMGRSFRVGWGPGGLLVHSGTPVGSHDNQGVLSSAINLEKVGMDRVARDESNKVREESVHLFFDAPLDFHKSISHVREEVEAGSFRLTLQKLVSDQLRLMLPDVCRHYIELVERQLEVPGLSASCRVPLMHQVMVWELIKVLFSEREISGQSNVVEADNEEDMMQDKKVSPAEVDPEALPLMRRAEFSYWLQESVYHRVQEDVGCLNESSDLEHIFLLLTGRQLDAAVELAASRGDVRLACLLSQAGGSMVNRSDIGEQLDRWRLNGLDFNFIENDRIRIYELLAGKIHAASLGKKIDWKRFLGLLMWYELPPVTDLPTVFYTYQHLLAEGKAPYPVPIYIDEGPVEETMKPVTEGHFDLAYYLMLLHASEGKKFGDLKSMFSAFASTNDPLDHHMIWHQRAILEAIGAFKSNDLHILDVGFVSQLLCLGQCHWAIYVILHMPYCEDFPYLHSTFIREILFQYCDTWSSQEHQLQFIENLGVPSVWLHEAMAVYFQYHGDIAKALEHFIHSSNWQKAHSIFITSVAHSLFLSAQHSEVWRLATSMEEYKSEIEDWDLGAGIYISFYLLRSSMQHDDNTTMTELDSLQKKDIACREFFGRINESLAVWGIRLPIDARVAYSKMAEELCRLLLSDIGENSTREIQLKCLDMTTSAFIAEDLRSSYLQDAVSLFTCYLSEATG